MRDDINKDCDIYRRLFGDLMGDAMRMVGCKSRGFVIRWDGATPDGARIDVEPRALVSGETDLGEGPHAGYFAQDFGR